MKYEDLNEFQKGYVECALWATLDDNGTPLDDNYSVEDISDVVLKRMVEDCDKFVSENAEDLLSLDPARCGHDFWLTRNGHGTGFWDRANNNEEEIIYNRLTLASDKFDTCDLYVGDDGDIYIV